MRNAPARSAALSYAASGWAVFPAHGIHAGRCTCGRPQCASPGKHPLTRRGLHDATTDGAVVRTWWGRWRFANVAVATGRASGIAVVDLDLPSAAGSFGDLVERLPSTLTALTGGGGVDLLYACDRSLGNSTGRLPGHPGALPGVDLRSDGGYIVAPPSSHLSSQRYSWLDPGATLASLPDWISEETPRG
ncbi:MAG: bifunctional DNA primase/polymerase, partial [Actinomycetota bacterium]